jgi:hypothetical protein
MQRKIFSVCLIAVGLLATFAHSVRAQSGTAKALTVIVTDETGAYVAHAQIRLVPNPDSPPENMETDGQGHFSIALKAGAYTLAVSAPGFKQASTHIDVAAPADTAGAGQIVPVVLHVATSSGMTVYATDSLLLTADRYHTPITLSTADFSALPHVTLTVHNSHTNADETYSGVPLAALLAKVNSPMGAELKGTTMTSYVVATGSDYYSVLLSLAEVDPSFHGGQVLVADTRDGQPLAASGPFELIVSDDKRPARWVHNLVAITLRNAQ